MAEPRWKVLIVDDNRGAAMALATLVSDLGFVLTLAESGEQALKLAWELRPQIVFVDMVLPDMDGVEVLQRLRAEVGLRDARFFSVSGYGESERLRSVGAGFEAHLGKPVRLEELQLLLKDEGLKS
jgi:CheY-like chemotaxis protein